MLFDSQSNIFTKSNLVYIPLSITIAHILNFIVNSPLSTWKEFPPKLSNSVYSSVFYTPLLLFISLTFEPIRTRKRFAFYTLLSLTLSVILIPIIYREKGYPPSLQSNLVAITTFFGLKIEPFISSSPRDFWSTRWQLLINESFKELGYLPVKNLFVSIFSRKIANIMGVLSAFGISASLHEYLIIANAYTWTGEHFFFFMTHGVIFILWEVVFISNKSKNENTMIEKFLKWVLFLIINLILLPALIEPSMRNFDFSDISSISKNF
ncbi:19974_t:CDS:2, partial [Rhizophagus irregularis]